MAKSKRQRRARPWLVRQCDRFEKHCLTRGLATRTEVQAARPPANAHTIEWCKYYGQLRAWLWVQDEVPGQRDEAEERMLAALREQPEPVPLLDGTTVHVYPKGIHALLWFREHDWLVGWLSARVEALRVGLEDGSITEADIAEPISTLERATTELGHQLAALASAACNEGPSLGVTEPSDRFLALDPWELYRINRAFLEVNAGRMMALARIVKPPKGNDDRPMSWNVFLGTLAMKLKIDPETLAKNRSLVSLLAQVRLSARAVDEDEVEEALGAS